MSPRNSATLAPLTATGRNRPTEILLGKLTATATREAGARFIATWYRRTYGRGRRRLVAVCHVTVPANYAATLVGLWRRLGLSQQQLAARVGAASKPVVYHWESGKRRPSPVLWLRIERLRRTGAGPIAGRSHTPHGLDRRAGARTVDTHCETRLEAVASR